MFHDRREQLLYKEGSTFDTTTNNNNDKGDTIVELLQRSESNCRSKGWRAKDLNVNNTANKKRSEEQHRLFLENGDVSSKIMRRTTKREITTQNADNDNNTNNDTATSTMRRSKQK